MKKSFFGIVFLLIFFQPSFLSAQLVNLDAFLTSKNNAKIIEIILKNKLFWTFPALSSQELLYEKAKTIKNNLSRLIAAGIEPEKLYLGQDSEAFLAKYLNFSVFSVSPAEAEFLGTSPEKLAKTWLNEARGILKLASRDVTGSYEGIASWYGHKFHGRRTSNGETFDMYQLTAAHKTLPFGSEVLVTNLRNGQTVVVKINDRGPFRKNRIIDLSLAAAQKIGFTGLTHVLIEVLK